MRPSMQPGAQSICCLCGDSDRQDFKALSEKTNEECGLTIYEVIQNFTKIDLTSARNSEDSVVCDSCVEKLDLIYEFTIACNLAQTTLRLIYARQEDTTSNKRESEDLSEGEPELDNDDNDGNDDEEDSQPAPSVVVVHEAPSTDRPKSLECPTCQKCFTSISNRNIHMKLHEQAEFECNECGKRFRSKLYLSKHIKFTHLVNEVRCPVCAQPFKNPAKLDYHLRAHDPNRKFPCKYCEKSFMQPHHLQNHERTHTQEKPFLCPICGKDFRQECNFKQHLKKHSTSRQYSCKHCQQVFGEREVYVTHLRQHSAPKRAVTCEKCSREFNTKAALVNHTRKAHHPAAVDHDPSQVMGLRFHPYVCEICNRGFKVPSSLVAHARVHSAAEDRKHHCDQCNSSFKRAEHLRIHINGIHLKLKKYKCDLCPRTFSQSGDRNQHMKSHSADKPFRCDYCDKQFRLQKALRTHLRTHTSPRERPYHCAFCKQTFMNYTALCKHTVKCEVNAAETTEKLERPLERKSSNYALITLPLESAQLQPLSTTVVITVPFKQVNEKQLRRA